MTSNLKLTTITLSDLKNKETFLEKKRYCLEINNNGPKDDGVTQLLSLKTQFPLRYVLLLLKLDAIKIDQTIIPLMKSTPAYNPWVELSRLTSTWFSRNFGSLVDPNQIVYYTTLEEDLQRGGNLDLLQSYLETFHETAQQFGYGRHQAILSIPEVYPMEETEETTKHLQQMITLILSAAPSSPLTSYAVTRLIDGLQQTTTQLNTSKFLRLATEVVCDSNRLPQNQKQPVWSQLFDNLKSTLASPFPFAQGYNRPGTATLVNPEEPNNGYGYNPRQR